MFAADKNKVLGLELEFLHIWLSVPKNTGIDYQAEIDQASS